jgi:hypothetical protein
LRHVEQRQRMQASDETVRLCGSSVLPNIRLSKGVEKKKRKNRIKTWSQAQGRWSQSSISSLCRQNYQRRGQLGPSSIFVCGCLIYVLQAAPHCLCTVCAGAI